MSLIFLMIAAFCEYENARRANPVDFGGDTARGVFVLWVIYLIIDISILTAVLK